jgi:hypothetical protein
VWKGAQKYLRRHYRRLIEATSKLSLGSGVVSHVCSGHLGVGVVIGHVRSRGGAKRFDGGGNGLLEDGRLTIVIHWWRAVTES